MTKDQLLNNSSEGDATELNKFVYQLRVTNYPFDFPDTWFRTQFTPPKLLTTSPWLSPIPNLIPFHIHGDQLHCWYAITFADTYFEVPIAHMRKPNCSIGKQSLPYTVLVRGTFRTYGVSPLLSSSPARPCPPREKESVRTPPHS